MAVVECRNISRRVDIQLLTVACGVSKKMWRERFFNSSGELFWTLRHRENNCSCLECQMLTALNPVCAWLPACCCLCHRLAWRMPSFTWLCVHRWLNLVADNDVNIPHARVTFLVLSLYTNRSGNLLFGTNQVRFTRKHCFYSYYLEGECLT